MNTERDWSSDAPITAAIERAILAGMHPRTPPINVAVQGATVTLTGHVANQACKDAVIELARRTEGVIDVIDDLVIGWRHPALDSYFPWSDPNKDSRRSGSR